MSLGLWLFLVISKHWYYQDYSFLILLVILQLVRRMGIIRTMVIVLATFFVRGFIEVSLWGVEFRLCKESCMIWRLGFREGFEVLVLQRLKFQR